MDFEFSADQEALRATVRHFLVDKAPMAYVREQLDDGRGTSDVVWKGLAGLGVTGLLVPEAAGGAGMGMVDMGVVLEEMGRAVHPGPFTSSAVAAASAIAAVATGEQQAELLPPLADGSVVATVALFEPGRSRWHEAATATSGNRVSGTKVHVPDAVAADLLLVTARDGDGGLGLFAVERGANGLTVAPTPTLDGTRKQGTVVLDRATARRLGPGDATAPLGGVVDRMLVALVADGVGAAQAALDLAVAYAKERVQFDRPIGSFQAVQHLCAEMLQTLEMARAGAYYGLWAADAADPAERHRAAVMAKAWASDGLFRVGAGAIQVFGGIGFTWEHDIHLFYKRLLSLQHAFGGTRHHLEELATLIL